MYFDYAQYDSHRTMVKIIDADLYIGDNAFVVDNINKGKKTGWL